MIELLGKSLEELQSIFKTHNIQKFRAKQLIDYIYHRYIFDFEDMTQFPKDLRQWLGDNCVISLPTLITESIAPDGKTRKILVEMSDQSRVEAAGANLFENGLIINYTPDADGLDACESLGERFANA